MFEDIRLVTTDLKMFFNKHRFTPSFILGKDRKLWEEVVYQFAQKTQLKAIRPYLPTEDYKLDPHIYEMVLYEYLKTDPPGFLNVISLYLPIVHFPTLLNYIII